MAEDTRIEVDGTRMEQASLPVVNGHEEPSPVQEPSLPVDDTILSAAHVPMGERKPDDTTQEFYR